MGQIVTGATYLTGGSAHASSAQANFPASNAYPGVTTPNRVWKSVEAIGTAVHVTADPGGTYNYSGYVLQLDNLNFTSCKVYVGDDINPATAGSAVSATVAVTQDLKDGRYKVWYDLSALAAQHGGTQRYVGVYANTTTTTDGGTAMVVGTLALLGGTAHWPTNPGFPYEVTPLQATLANDDFIGGGREPAIVGNRYCQITLTQSAFPTSMASTIDTVLGYGEGVPFSFYRNNSNTSECYIVRRVGTVRTAQAGPNHLTVSSILLEEVV